jgi:hypothetical protein
MLRPKRRMLRIALTCLLALLLTACVGPEAPLASPTALPSTAVPTLTEATPLIPTSLPARWQPVSFDDEGVIVSFEVPADWQALPGRRMWAPEPDAGRLIGVYWNSIPPDGSIETSLLPNHSETRHIQPLNLGWTTAQLYHVVRHAPASASSGITAIEHHAVVELDRGGIRQAYDLYVSAPDGRTLDATYGVFQHMLDSFFLDTSAITLPPTPATVPPGSTLPHMPTATPLAEHSPEHSVQAFYEWYTAYEIDRQQDDMLRPYHEGIFYDSPYLTDELIRQVNNRRMSPAPGDYDPLTCGTSYPQRFQIAAASIEGDTAQVTMQICWDSALVAYDQQQVDLVLRRVDGRWQIAEVSCRDRQAQQEIALYWAVGEALQPEYRTISAGADAPTRALELLLQGPDDPRFGTSIPTPQEVQTYSGRRPDWGDRVRLLSLSIVDGVATADFSQEMQAYGGGSARVDMIRRQITHTLLQFPGVDHVRIAVEGNVETALQP